MSLHFCLSRKLLQTPRNTLQVSSISQAAWLALGMLWIAQAAGAAETARCENFAARLDSLEGRVQWQATGDNQWHEASLNQTFCYGDTLIVQEKRAALRLSNNTLVRLNEHSSLKLIPPDKGFWVELSEGAAHFLTRTPKSFTVKAPYVNAAVEGTEFLVTAENGSNQVGVIEGVVRSGNPAGSVLLMQGQSTRTSSSQQSPGAPVVLKLNDFVSWAMYFPPLPNRLNLPEDVKAQLAKGEDGQVIQRISQDQQASAEILSLGAALALNRGQLPQAQQLVQRALTLNPKHPDAQAIAALIDLGSGNVERGQQRAAQNVLDNPFNPTALIAHSYSQQGQGRLEGALDSALEAQRIAPTDSQIIARVAELNLALGRKAQARTALDKALALAPNHSRLLTFKGFSLLAQRKGRAAQSYFSKASSIDSGDPYTHLGWGMALIQQGHLEQGREHLELAVVLDPANSLLRSYLGKGYFEENRLKLAETQLNLAQTLDPNDPTPWYYLSQVKHDQNHYGEALQLIETAIDKNANRAVYRQDGALDSDESTRLADKARIYQAMGAEQLAINAAADAVRAAPNDYAGHRAMAIALTGKEGAQTARANEALQASLLAPIGATPLAPGFAETAMQVLPGAGPHEIGINEYNAAFTPNGINGFVAALGAGNNTRATEGQVQLVGEKTDLSLGQYHYSSDGFKENNDRDYLVNEAKLKYQVTDNFLAQVTAGEREDDLGDISESIARDVLSSNVRSKSKKEAYSAGFVYSPAEKVKVLGVKTRKHENFDSHFENSFPGFLIKNDEQSIVRSDITQITGNIASVVGQFFTGYEEYTIHRAGDFYSAFEVDGISLGEPEVLYDAATEKMKSYYLEYIYENDWLFGGVGVERQNIKDFYSSWDESLIKGELGLNCPFDIFCKATHDEFVSLPIQGRESFHYRLRGTYAGRTDYAPYSQIKIDALSFVKEGQGWGGIVSYQDADIRHAPEYDNELKPMTAPDFHEQEYSAQVATAFGGLDALTFTYAHNKSKTLYREGIVVRGSIPHKANTEMIGLMLEKAVLDNVIITANLKSIDQKYLFPLQNNILDFPTRVRFINLDLNLRYEPTHWLQTRISVLNALENKKPYVDDAPANMNAQREATLDSFIAERVVALSAKINF
ncbi:MAG TPA: FecR domain-containing protein [Cellvibrionaceae bacterium]